MKLNEKQRRFVDEYIIDLNATQAAIRAGYTPRSARNTASRMMANDNIAAAIKKKMDELNKESIAKQEEVLEILTNILRGEENGTALVGIGKGAQRVSQEPPTVAEKIRAAELIGKRYGIWTEKQVVDVSSSVTFIDDIGDEDDEA